MRHFSKCLPFAVVVACGCNSHPAQQPASEPKPTAAYTHCVNIGGSGNRDGMFSMTTLYRCGKDVVEIGGEWGQSVEYGQVYDLEYDSPVGTPRRATQFDRYQFQWCRDVGNLQITTCGVGTKFAPKSTWDDPWNPDPLNYPMNSEVHDAN